MAKAKLDLDSHNKITFLQLQLHEQKFSKSKTNSCENEEKIVIENLIQDRK